MPADRSVRYDILGKKQTARMKQFLLIPFILLLSATLLYSQSDAYISGRVTGHEKGINGTMITLLDNGRETFTQADGSFTFDHLFPGYYRLKISSPGFAVQYITLHAANDTSIALIRLRPEWEVLEEVIVNSEKRKDRIQDIPSGVSVFSEKDIADFRIWNLSQLSNIVPTLYAANPGDNRN